MKCPKCHYLGFETGDRCKNCGYDLSLISEPEISVDSDLDIELTLRASDDTLPATVQWDDNFEHLDADALADAAALAESPTTMEISDPNPKPASEMPREAVTRFNRRVPSVGAASLFDESDEPLIRLPAAPRAPLAVRRTPEAPRLRAVARPVPRPSRAIDASPALDFVEDPPAPVVESMSEVRARTVSRLSAEAARAAQTEVSGPFARLAAAAIDHLLLTAIDVAVAEKSGRVSRGGLIN